MTFPSFKPKRTKRTVINLEDLTEDLTLTVGTLREIITEIEDFSDGAQITFNINRGYIYPYETKSHHPVITSLLIEENR